MVVNKGLFRPADKETKKHKQFELVNTPEEGHQQSSRNVKVSLNLHLQQNMIVLNMKRAQINKIGGVRNVEGMKVVQMNTLDVTSVPESAFEMMLSDINSSNPHFSIILGDFNVRSNNWWQGDTQTSEGS